MPPQQKKINVIVTEVIFPLTLSDRLEEEKKLLKQPQLLFIEFIDRISIFCHP